MLICRLLMIFVVVMAALAAPVNVLAEGAHPESKTEDAKHEANTNPLSVDPDLAIFTAIVFVLLMLVLLKFAWRPIMEGLDKRESGIAGQIEEARMANEKANETLVQYQAKLAAAADEIREQLAQGRREADAAKEKIVSEAQEAAKRERERALAEIAAAKNAALGEIATTYVDQAFGLARQVVSKEINRDDHAQLIRESLDKFSSKN